MQHSFQQTTSLPTFKAYINKLLTAEEKTSCLIQEDFQGGLLLFTLKGIYEILQEEQGYTYRFYETAHLKPLMVTQHGTNYLITIETLGGRSFRLLFLQQRDAHRIAENLIDLYSY